MDVLQATYGEKHNPKLIKQDSKSLKVYNCRDKKRSYLSQA